MTWFAFVPCPLASGSRERWALRRRDCVGDQEGCQNLPRASSLEQVPGNEPRNRVPLSAVASRVRLPVPTPDGRVQGRQGTCPRSCSDVRGCFLFLNISGYFLTVAKTVCNRSTCPSVSCLGPGVAPCMITAPCSVPCACARAGRGSSLPEQTWSPSTKALRLVTDVVTGRVTGCESGVASPKHTAGCVCG